MARCYIPKSLKYITLIFIFLWKHLKNKKSSFPELFLALLYTYVSQMGKNTNENLRSSFRWTRKLAAIIWCRIFTQTWTKLHVDYPYISTVFKFLLGWSGNCFRFILTIQNIAGIISVGCTVILVQVLCRIRKNSHPHPAYRPRPNFLWQTPFNKNYRTIPPRQGDCTCSRNYSKGENCFLSFFGGRTRSFIDKNCLPFWHRSIK
jgi:hypothetical protein